MMRAREVARGEEAKWDVQVWYSEASSDREGGSEVQWGAMLCGFLVWGAFWWEFWRMGKGEGDGYGFHYSL